MSRFESKLRAKASPRFRMRAAKKSVEVLEPRVLRSGSDDRIKVLAHLLPTAEIHLLPAKKPSANPQDVQFVTNLYPDLTGHKPKAADLKKITAKLAKTHNRDQAVSTVLASQDYLKSKLGTLYGTILG